MIGYKILTDSSPSDKASLRNVSAHQYTDYAFLVPFAESVLVD